jgi:excisionase family DNA binding protein
MATSEPKTQPLALRVNDAARAIGVSRSKLYLMAKAKEIRIVKIGGVAVVPWADLVALLPTAA